MFENSLAMDIHLEDRSNHLLFSHVQLNFFLPELVFFHMGISLGKKKERRQQQQHPKKPPKPRAAKGSKWDLIVLDSQQNVECLQ